ncbi:hypothetical protein F66182_7309 [Fusarium sp. NRRL 66182]|nr:hypothetical protein F66182_7309 [Fusarium sp. NRRL 66182]
MCLFNLFSKNEDKPDLPPARPANVGKRTSEATSRLQGTKFASDSSRRSSADENSNGYGAGYPGSGRPSLGVGGPHGGLYGGVNGGVYSGVSGGPNGGVNGGVYGGVSGTSHGGGLAPAGGLTIDKIFGSQASNQAGTNLMHATTLVDAWLYVLIGSNVSSYVRSEPIYLIGMADPLSISASIAGLASLADLVFRHGTKYAKGYKGAQKEVEGLFCEVKSLSLALYNLSLVAFDLEESEDVASQQTTNLRPHHLHSCQTLPRRLETALTSVGSALDSESGLDSPRVASIDYKNPDSVILQWLFVGRVSERSRISNGTADVVTGRKSWSGTWAAEVSLKWEQRKRPSESILHYPSEQVFRRTSGNMPSRSPIWMWSKDNSAILMIAKVNDYIGEEWALARHKSLDRVVDGFLRPLLRWFA